MRTKCEKVWVGPFAWRKWTEALTRLRLLAPLLSLPASTALCPVPSQSDRGNFGGRNQTQGWRRRTVLGGPEWLPVVGLGLCRHPLCGRARALRNQRVCLKTRPSGAKSLLCITQHRKEWPQLWLREKGNGERTESIYCHIEKESGLIIIFLSILLVG